MHVDMHYKNYMSTYKKILYADMSFLFYNTCQHTRMHVNMHFFSNMQVNKNYILLHKKCMSTCMDCYEKICRWTNRHATCALYVSSSQLKYTHTPAPRAPVT
jgi:hypothetical protein